MRKILVIDDNQSDLITIKNLLETHFLNTKIIVTKSDKEGIDLSNREKPDVVLIDIATPAILDVCAYLKSNEFLKYTPVITSTSALSNKENKIKTLEIGVDGFFSKPIDEFEIIAQIKTMLRIKELENEKIEEKYKLTKIAKENAAALKKIEETFSKAFKSSPFAITLTRFSDGKFIEINNTVEKLLGYSRDKFIGQTSDDLDLYVNRNDKKYLAGKLIKEGSVHNYETQFYTKDGNIITAKQSLEMIILNDEQCVLSTYEDITERKKIKKTLENKDKFFQSLIENSVDAIIIIDLHNTIIYESPSAKRITGLKIKDQIGKSIFDFIHPEDKHIVTKTLTELILRPNEPHHVTLRNQHKDKSWRWLECTLTILLEEPTIKGIIINAHDITDRKKAEDALNEIKDSYIGLFNSVTEAIYIISEKGIFIDVNNGAVKMYGFSREELIGKTPEFVSAPQRNDMNHVASLINKVAKTGKTEQFDFWGIRKNGEIFPKEVVCNKGTYMGKDVIIATARDITERKKAEDALKESEELFRNTIELAVDGIILGSENGFLIDANSYTCELTGFSKKELLNKNLDELICNDILKNKPLRYDLLQKGEIITTERVIVRKDGIKIPVEMRSKKMPNGTYQSFLRNITERKKTEKALVESENKFRTLAESSPFAIMIYQGDHWVYSNKAGEEISGFSTEELYKMKYWEFVEKDYQNKIIQQGINRQNREKPENSYEFKINSKDGKQKWVYLTGMAINYMDKPAGIISVVDITERKKAEQIQNVIYTISNAVITSKNIEELVEIIRVQLGSLLDTTNFYIAIYDETTNMLTSLYANDEKDTISTWSAEKSLTGQVIKNNKPLLATKKEIIELYKQGKIEIVGTIAESWLGVPLHIDGKITGAFIVQSYNNPLAYNSKDVEMLEFISRQISISIQRKKSIEDLHIALEKAEESDQLKTAFLANMSHEIRTPMNAILGFSSLLNDDDLIEDERNEFVNIIKNNGQHLLSIINDIIDVAKIDSKQLSLSNVNFNLNNLLNELFISYENEKITKEKNSIEFQLEKAFIDSKSDIISDDVRLRQILYNLLGNALKFTNSGYIKFGYKLEKKNLLFFVEDTGKGIAKDKQSFVFERFRQEEETYTRQFGGTGLGLTISKGLVELLGGKMWLVSEENKGSTFYFEIPYKTTNINCISEKTSFEKAENYNFKGKTLLIAEDEETNLLLIKIMLSGLNLNILQAFNGKEAIEIFKNNPTISLVLMDLKMPVLDGLTATQELKKLRPDIPVIAQTAYALSNDKEEVLAKGCDDYISKPIDKQILIETIAKYLI